MARSRSSHPAGDRLDSAFGGGHWTAPVEEEPLRYLQPSQLPGTEFIFARNCSRRWRVYHESYVVCLCFRASAEWRYGGRLRPTLFDQSYMLMEPGEVHINVKVPSPQTYNVVRIAPEVMAGAATELGVRGAPHFTLALDHNPLIWRSFDTLTRAVDEGGGPLEQQSRLAHGLRLLLEHCIEKPRATLPRRLPVQRSKIDRCKEYLRERYQYPVSLDELAAIAGLSRFHLLRSFQLAVGVPPHAYQIQLRVERACRLMQAGARPSQAASAVGFADQSHLTRHFRRIMYVTPGAYRAARR
jgi:AraC-like DNA-binding protein